MGVVRLRCTSQRIEHGICQGLAAGVPHGLPQFLDMGFEIFCPSVPICDQAAGKRIKVQQ